MKKRMDLNLAMFDGGAAGAAGGTGAGGTAGAAGTGAEGAAGSADAGTGAGAGREAGSGEGPGKDGEGLTAEDRRAEYERVKEQYKDLFGEDVKQAVDRRYEPMRRMQAQLDSYGPLMETLAAKYGTDSSDVEGMLKAIGKDDSFFEQKAMEEGMPVERYKEFVMLQAKNRALEEATRRSENLRQQRDTWARWDSEAEKCRSQFPGFDIAKEIEANPQFVKLLGSGIDVTTAYKASHFDEISEGLIAQSEKATKKRVADTIRAGAGRPSEGAAGKAQPGTRTPDFAHMPREEFLEYRRKVMSGEITSLS